MHRLRAVALRAQVLDLQLLALDRDLLHARGGLVLLDGRAQTLVVDLEHELTLRHVVAFGHVDLRDAADLLRRELHLLLVDEAARREHRRLDRARRERLDLDLDGDAAAEARLQQRNRDHDDHDPEDDQDSPVHGPTSSAARRASAITTISASGPSTTATLFTKRALRSTADSRSRTARATRSSMRSMPSRMR